MGTNLHVRIGPPNVVSRNQDIPIAPDVTFCTSRGAGIDSNGLTLSIAKNDSTAVRDAPEKTPAVLQPQDCLFAGGWAECGTSHSENFPTVFPIRFCSTLEFV